MDEGICIDTSGVNNLKLGEKYYLFECGQVAYYVSKFPKVNSHMGVYQRSRFELISEDHVFNETDNGQLVLF